jgi:hypothetical protein
MGSRRYPRKKQTRLEDHLWTIVGFVSLVLFFILLNWLGIVGTFVLLGLLLCLVLGLRYGWPAYQLHVRSQTPVYQPSNAPASGFGLTPPAQVRAQVQERAPAGGYNKGYQAQGTNRAQGSGQPKQDRPADYEQPQAQYPDQMPPPTM